MDKMLGIKVIEIDFLRCNQQLLSYIKNNGDARSYINAKQRCICNAVGDYGLNLYYAAFHGSERIIEHLIGLGVDVDFKYHSMHNTPLMAAIARKNRNAVKVLLDAGADIHFINNCGLTISALQVALKRECDDSVLELIIRSMRNGTTTLEMFVERLIAVWCSPFHVAILRDVEVMKCYMLERGIDVNSEDLYSPTALDAVVRLDDLEIVEFLFDKVTEKARINALVLAVVEGKCNMLKYLLQRGVDPNGGKSGLTPLLWAIVKYDYTEHGDKCIEILLQQGADPQIKLFVIFFYLLKDEPFKLYPVIAHLAMLEMLGTPILESFYARISSIRKYKNYYESCRRILKVEIFESIKLFDLLVDNEDKMKTYMHDEKCPSKLIHIGHKHKLVVVYPYYFNYTIKQSAFQVSRGKCD